MGLITKEVEIILHKTNIKHFENLGYEIPRRKDVNGILKIPRGTKIIVKVEHLTDGSNTKVEVECDGCSKKLKNIRWTDYLKGLKEDGKYYCHKCANKLYGYGVQKRLSEKEIKNIIKEKLGENWQLLGVIIDRCTYVVLIDENGYKYSKINIQSIKRRGGVNFVHISNLYTIHNIKLWLKLNNKPFELVSDKYEHNKKLLKWKCLKEECQEVFEMRWNNVSNNQGCPFCNGKQVGLSNCLATKNPELSKEWHPTKNGKLTPYNVTHRSDKKVWWLCSNNSRHEWFASIKSRNTTNCPYCSGNLPSEDYNLLIINPELCKEWDYEKNKKKPEEYTPGSDKKVWWKCLDCNHSWKSLIKHRNNSSGCPECNKSKGEKECKRVFISKGFIKIERKEYKELSHTDKNNNVYFIPQMKFDGLVGLKNRLLSYDFYLPKYNFLIEYQGEQHEKYIPGFHKSKKDFEKQLEYDRRKREYAQNNNINLLEIWYYDFNNIEEILDKELAKLGIIISKNTTNLCAK